MPKSKHQHPSVVQILSIAKAVDIVVLSYERALAALLEIDAVDEEVAFIRGDHDRGRLVAHSDDAFLNAA